MTPDQYTLSEKMIDVGDGHQLYAMLWGNPDGETVIFLHGGPGSGCSDSHKTLFDPNVHRAIFFDQRGCGKSLPYGSLEHNTTDELVEDVGKVADTFGAKTFTITGGSWGSTLALAYALKHPGRVKRMVLRGIFTSRQSEIDFIDKGGLKPFFPDLWEDFVNAAPKAHRDNPGAYHSKQVLGDDPEAAKASAYAYAKLEGGALRLDDRTTVESYDDFDPVGTMIEVHYLVNRCFLPEGHIIKHAHQLTMPILLIQGRYDSVCPPETAYELNKALPSGRLVWVQAGHSGSDRAIWETTKVALLA